MGWLRRLFRRTAPRPPPWVNPQFLGVFAVLGASGALLWFLAGEAPPSSPDEPAPRQAYAGMAAGPDVLERLTLDCDDVCLADAALAAWKAAHPQARILSTEPVYERGLMLGHRITYVEEQR